jgi:AraC-like DNA-binding protein
VQHIEFVHKDHFEHRYHRKKPSRQLAGFIDFFWEIDFDDLWVKYPEGFSDALFPNIGYTYMINLGTPFTLELGLRKFRIKSDAFLPRHKQMVCHHSPGNKIFGIKFLVSPVIFEKKVNFYEYREHIYPLAYLIDRNIMDAIKTANSFEKRVEIITRYYVEMVLKYSGSMKQVEVVTDILKRCTEKNHFNTTIETFAAEFEISARTLQRYFTATTSISSKQALQILRIRKAVEHMSLYPKTFHWADYGYFDYSHFRKHLKSFLGNKEALISPVNRESGIGDRVY